MFLNSSGSSWSYNAGWFSNSNHCTWAGVTCTESFQVTRLAITNNQLAGAFPSDLNNLSHLELMSLPSNSLIGIIPDDACAKSTSDNLFINADAANCPNDFDTSTGTYQTGCCDNILYDVDIYLNKFAAAVLGNTDCQALGGTETTVCDYMTNPTNHDIFANGYPEDFPGVWNWLQVRM